MGLILSLDNSIHSFNRAGFVGLLDEYTGAAAGYSLRRLSYNTTDVVRVRRSSDNAEADFTADEITDGTMLNWVNADVVQYTSDFTSTENLFESNGIGAAAQSVAGVNNAYKFTLSGGNTTHLCGILGLQAGVGYTVSFDYYIPSTNGKVDGIRVRNLVANTGFNVLDSWQSETVTTTSSPSNDLFFQALDGTAVTIDADGDVFYLKNIVVTQTTADGHVTTWYDQAGSNDATQSTAANQPKIVDAGVLVEENGKPAIDFGTISENKCLTVNTSPITNNFVTIVHNIIYKSNKNQVLLALSNSNYIIITATDAGKLKYVNSNDDMISTTNVGSFQLSTIDINDGKLYTNNLEEDNVTTASGATSRYVIGNYTGTSGNELEGYVSEIVTWQTAQTSNRVGIETNINNHYNIYP